MENHSNVPFGHVKLLVPEILEKFIQAILKGASYHLACKHAGLSFTQYRVFMLRCEKMLDEDKDELGNPIDESNPYIETYRRIERAIAYRALKWLEKIDEAANIHWQAAAWKLERCHPEDYAREKPELEKKADENAEGLRELKEIVHKCMKPIA